MARNGIEKLLASESPFINLAAIQSMYRIGRESARTKASRLAKKGILIRHNRDLYTIVNRGYSLFALANALFQPSVVSLETALNYWGLTVQVPQTVFSIALKSRQCVSDATVFVYRQIDVNLFRFGQVKRQDFFIADAEKALLDTLYMCGKGLTELLPEDVDMGKVDLQRIESYLRLYPNYVSKKFFDFRRVEYEAK